MPACCVPKCTNRSEKGFLVKKFPKDPTRRALWAKCIARLDWTPKDTSYICEVHFEDNMWEVTRVDGQRKLKCNAIPTLFPYYTVKTILQKESTSKQIEQTSSNKLD